MKNSQSLLFIIRKLLLSLSWRQVALILLFVGVSVFSAVLEVLSGASLAFLASHMGSNAPTGNLAKLTHFIHAMDIPGKKIEPAWVLPALICAVILLMANTFQILAYYLRFEVALGGLRKIRFILARYYLSQDLEFYSKTHSSGAIASIISEAQRMYFNILGPAAALVHAGMITLIVASAAIWINPSAGCFAGTVFGLAYTIYYFGFKKFFLHADRLISASSTERQKLLGQAFEGIREFIFWDRRDWLLRAFRDCDYRASKAEALSVFLSSIPRNIIEILIITITLTFFLLFPRSGSSTVSLGEIVFYGYAMIRLLPAMQSIFTSIALHAMGRSSTIPVCTALMHSPPTRRQPSGKEEKQRLLDFDAGKITLKNVSYRHTESRGWALQNITLEIPCKKLVAFVGPTGSGKSTALDILGGLLFPQKGKIVFRGKTVGKEQWHAYRKKFGYLPQNFFLLAASVGENISFGNARTPHDESGIQSAAAEAQISDFIHSLPGRYDEPLGERGVRLSGGQRQRIGFARVLFSKAQILLFDEPTSALDQKTEGLILETLLALKKNHTVVLVTHKKAAWKMCDLVYHFEKGRIQRVTRKSSSAR